MSSFSRCCLGRSSGDAIQDVKFTSTLIKYYRIRFTSCVQHKYIYIFIYHYESCSKQHISSFPGRVQAAQSRTHWIQPMILFKGRSTSRKSSNLISTIILIRILLHRQRNQACSIGSQQIRRSTAAKVAFSTLGKFYAKPQSLRRKRFVDVKASCHRRIMATRKLYRSFKSNELTDNSSRYCCRLLLDSYSCCCCSLLLLLFIVRQGTCQWGPLCGRDHFDIANVTCVMKLGARENKHSQTQQIEGN